MMLECFLQEIHLQPVPQIVWLKGLQWFILWMLKEVIFFFFMFWNAWKNLRKTVLLMSECVSLIFDIFECPKNYLLQNALKICTKLRVWYDLKMPLRYVKTVGLCDVYEQVRCRTADKIYKKWFYRCSKELQTWFCLELLSGLNIFFKRFTAKTE